MKMSEQVKPISYLKAHAADVVRDLTEAREPLVFTRNGEARLVVQDVESYEKTKETMALLRILALGNRQVEEGKVVSAAERFVMPGMARNPADHWELFRLGISYAFARDARGAGSKSPPHKACR